MSDSQTLNTADENMVSKVLILIAKSYTFIIWFTHQNILDFVNLQNYVNIQSNLATLLHKLNKLDSSTKYYCFLFQFQPVLYSYWRSSCSWRVRIALNLKEIQYDIKAVSLIKGGGEQHCNEYREVNPMEQVPSLCIGEKHKKYLKYNVTLSFLVF